MLRNHGDVAMAACGRHQYVLRANASEDGEAALRRSRVCTETRVATVIIPDLFLHFKLREHRIVVV